MAYVQMPFYAGGNLRQWLGAAPIAAGRKAQRKRLLRGLLDAVKHVHDVHMVHNDIKLENVVLTDAGEAGEAVLIDFEYSHDEGNYSETKKLGGTNVYMAPEREHKNGRPAHPGDARSDMYSVRVHSRIYAPHNNDIYIYI